MPAPTSSAAVLEQSGAAASAATTELWGPGQVVDPTLVATQRASGLHDLELSSKPLPLARQYKPHVLPAWGKESLDLAVPRGTQRFAALVRPNLACIKCGRRDDVRLLQHHPGSCGAFEWTYGIDIDWRWTCCGKHESFHHMRACQPTGFHKTGCVNAPLCSRCFKCPCAALIERRQEQEDNF